MQVTDATTRVAPVSSPDWQAEALRLRREADSRNQQFDWSKLQLFGLESEKRLIDSPAQLDLAEVLVEAPAAAPVPATEQITYTRRMGRQRDDDCVADVGLRFDDRVPVEFIDLSAPLLQGPDADRYQAIDQKITRRLAQHLANHVVLEYRRPVIGPRDSATLMEVAAPSSVFEGSVADVSLLAGLQVDKFVYHLPKCRQQPRLGDAGITLSRSTLTHYSAAQHRPAASGP